MDENDDEFDMDFDMAEVLAVMDQVDARTKTTKTTNGLNSNSKYDNTNDTDHNTNTNTGTNEDTVADFDDEFDDFDEFDDVDVNALMNAADTVEKNIAKTSRNQAQSSLTTYYGSSSTANASSSSSTRSTGISNSRNLNNTANATTTSSTTRITFGIPEDMEDPTPPPPPPADAKTFHPFDASTLPTWIYPTNHPIRGYQFNIVRKALFSNTLVSIPTGLGKTFIAAVVMYNYYRWFPNSIMIFMAPTRPLVEQQIKACHDVCGIPQKDTVMMVGTGGKVKRPELWKKGRIFFCTPQVVDNDIANGICPAHKVILLVIDEAHKATGNYAYTNVIERLGRIHSYFRVLALSATPGSTVEKVQTVVDNLRINTIEVRTEESMDVQEFSFGKRVQSIVIKLNYTSGATGTVPKIAQTFCEQVLQPILDRLAKRKAIYSPSVERCTHFTLLSDRKRFQVDAKNVNQVVKTMITVDFMLAETCARAYEGLCVYGVGTFVDIMDRFLQSMRTSIEQGKNISKEHYKLLNHFGLKQLLDQAREQLAIPGFVGHPKLESLLNTILRHFNDCSEESNDDISTASSSSRIIVFSSLRASVNMIVDFLSVHHPLIKCTAFIGQSGDAQGAKGMSQKEQQQTIERFKKGDVNVMVATCIGEEGLDIGEVDLIVCYDSQSSSIRLLQRMGRTGRRRKGHCVMLMTEQEERKFKKANDSYKFIQNCITKQDMIKCSDEITALLPPFYQPVVQRKKLVIGNYITDMVQGMKRRRQDDNSVGIQKNGTLTDQGLEAFLATFPDRDFSTLDQAYDHYWPLIPPLKRALKYLSLQQYPSRTKRVGHSRRTLQLTSLMATMEDRILEVSDISGGDTLQTPHNTNGRNYQGLQLPKRRNPTDNKFTSNTISLYDDIDDYAPKNNDTSCNSSNNSNSNNTSKLILPKARKSATLLMNGGSKQHSDIVEDAFDVAEDTDWSGFMEPLMAKGMADDEDTYYQDYQNDYYQNNYYEYDLTADNVSPNRKTVATVTIASDSSIDSDDEQRTRGLDKKKQPAVPVKDDFDDEFDAMDLDLWDDMEAQAMKTGSIQKMQESAAPPPPPLGFLFDDDLPPLISDEEQKTNSTVAHSSASFSTSFVWATSNPVFSEDAKQFLSKRLRNSNNHYLSIRLLGAHCESRISTEPIIITADLPPPLAPTKSFASFEFNDDDDIDFSKLEEIIDNATQAPPKNQPNYMDPETPEQIKPPESSSSNNNSGNCGNNSNSFTNGKETILDINNIMNTSSWSITDSQPALCDIETTNIPQSKTTVNNKTATVQGGRVNNHQDNINIPYENSPKNSIRQTVEKDCDMDGGSTDSWEINDEGLGYNSPRIEGSLNGHQNNSVIPNKKSPSSPIKQVEEMNCVVDGGSVDSWEINDDELDASSIHATPLDNSKNFLDSPIPVVPSTPLTTATEMATRPLMHSTPQNQHLQQRLGKGSFENRSQYLYSPTDNSNNNNTRSPIRLISPQKESSMKMNGTPTIHSVDDDSHDNSPIIRRNRIRRKPIISDSEDERSLQSPNLDLNKNDTTPNTSKYATSVIMMRSSDNEENDDDDYLRRRKKPTKQHRPRSKHWVENPFLDNEAELSDDGADTGDEEEVDGGSNVMDSFICDGSSGLVPEGDSSLISTTHDNNNNNNSGDDRGKKRGDNDIAMYRTSLLQDDVAATHGAPPALVFSSGFRRKTWLDKMETKKWEYVADDDEENEDEVYHNASDMYSDAMLDGAISGDGVSEDISRFTNASDDFM